MTQQFMTSNIFTSPDSKSSKIKNIIAFLAVTALAVLVSLIFAPKAHATTYNVTQTPPSACTLVEAFEAAATDIAVGACAAGDGDDTINVGQGTYTLAADLGSIVTSGNISVIGEDATNTIIDGAGFAGITFAAQGNYLMENLTFTGFVSTAEGSTLFINGGGNVTANKLIVRQNTCTAAIPVCAIALTFFTDDISTTISNSSFYQNTAFFLFANARVPGELASGSSTMNIFNNTIFDNTSGIVNTANSDPNPGTAVTNFYNNTVAQNSPYADYVDLMFVLNVGEAPAFYSSELNLRNNVLSGNTNLAGEDANCGSYVGENGILTSDGGNISDDATCNAIFTSSNDKNSTDPLLAAYQQVGSTFVMPLQAGSPALENAVAGAPATPAVDQRGVTRPQSAIADSGAYEYVAPVPTPTPSAGTLASTGWDTRLPVLLATLFVLAGLTGVGYALKKN